MALHNKEINPMDKELTEIKERLRKLEKVVFGERIERKGPTKIGVDQILDFSLNDRAFIKKYSSGFNGHEFFTLICSYLAKGKNDAVVELLKTKETWKGCLGIIGLPYSSIFSTRAKENSWVDVVKDARGSYILGKYWQDVFKKHEQNP